ncbi:MAG: hypothetical protein J1E63_07830 [Muribaculaceae bacterium]|nr:hypothetical protein [Muribaculaceae bacterium]
MSLSKFFPFLKRKSSRGAGLKPSRLIADALSELQCDIKNTGNQDDCNYTSFTYQSGHFVSHAYNKCDLIKIVYPSINEWTLDDASKVARLCNIHSQNAFGHTFTCRLDDNKIVVDISSMIWTNGQTSITGQLTDLMQSIFIMQRHFCETVEREEDSRPISEAFLDTTLLNFARVQSRQDFEQQKDTSKNVFDYQEFTIKDLIDQYSNFDSSILTDVKLTVIYPDRNTRSIDNTAEALAVVPEKLMAANIDSLTVIAYLTFPGENRPRVLTIQLERSSRNGGVYFALNMFPARINDGLHIPPDNSVGAITGFLMLPPGRNAADYMAEVKFMRDDALDKIREGKADQLTEQQQLMIDVNVPNLDWLIYMGVKAFTAERYGEAIYYLTPVARELLSMRCHLSGNIKSKAAKILVMTALANYYNHNIEAAFYYLDPMAGLEDISIDLNLIQVLSKNGDFRARVLIERLLNAINDAEQQSDDEAAEDSDLNMIRRDLNRRLVDLFINNYQFEEAETVLMPMKDGPDSEFAADRLNIIARMRGEQS